MLPSHAGSPAEHKTARLPQHYLYLASYTFALVGFELVLVVVEHAFGLARGSFLAQIIHWALTIVVWVGGAIGLLIWASRRTAFTLTGVPGSRIGAGRWSSITALVVVTIFTQWALRGGVIPPVAELAAFVQQFGAAGSAAWLVQVLYYGAEVLVITALIAFAQKAGDLWLRVRWVPWGGLFLATTWGLVHFLTQDAATGLYGLSLSLIMGTIYVLAGRSFLVAYPVLLVVFIV